MTEHRKSDIRDAVLGIAGAGTALLIASSYERRTLTKAVYGIRTDKPIVKDRTIAFITDLHDCSYGTGNRKLVSMIDSAHPDAVLIGGDMMVTKGHADILKTLDLCENLSEKYPVYYGNGNHETRLDRERERYGNMYDELTHSLCDMGVFHLSDSSAMLDNDICITGLNITENYYRNFCCDRMNASYIENHVGRASDRCFQILLSHSPLFLDAYAAWGADLTLSGHFHGGTVRLPGDIGLMTPQFQFFSSNVVGLKEKNGSKMIISAGTGTHSINVRLNNKPQVVVVNITRQ